MDENRIRVQGVFDAAERLAGIDGFVMIGGYAVSARARPRFSHDLDIVVSVPALFKVHDALRACKFEPKKRFANPDKEEEGYGGEMVRWSRDDTRSTMDIMAGGLRDPKVKVWIPYEKIARGKSMEKVPNVLGIPGAPLIPTAATEVLIALKLQPGRPQDNSDLVSMAQAADAAKTVEALLDMFGRPLALRLVRRMVDDIRPGEDLWSHGVRYQMPKAAVEKAMEKAGGFFEGVAAVLERAK